MKAGVNQGKAVAQIILGTASDISGHREKREVFSPETVGALLPPCLRASVPLCLCASLQPQPLQPLADGPEQTPLGRR
ncbi:hypothetical protein EYF80_038271 [Liparis tanakae]|uniref:Uncharacterized protein n=1 Tax=Liparis tanakae TaxID=230148 RepID=A0A4Z2GE35_9TELE|nr:hypothetical protein EYF80_038271 [Liparis tanakae]